jgi:SAM-dependent methyltransferase/DNA-binding transcriptional ArsR family regulator
MASITKTLRVLADPNRLRILLLLKGEELSVAELQEILAMGQSTISTHLSQLKQAELVEDRRTGKSNLYRLATQFLTSDGLQHPEVSKEHDFAPADPGALQGHDSSRAESGRKPAGALAPEGSFLNELLARAGAEIPEAAADQAAMRCVLKKRQDKTRAFFDSVAGRMGKDYVPGKSWKSLAEALLRLMPPIVVADMGAGEGAFALLLAQRARKVIAVDSSAKMIEVGREQAQRAGIKNIEYRLGDMEEIPIGSGEVDVVFFSQSLHHALHPERALAETARVLAPGGRVVVLDLLKHRFEEARELYADEWLGFSEAELESMLASAGFANIETAVVDKEPEPPQFQTLLAVGSKPV